MMAFSGTGPPSMCIISCKCMPQIARPLVQRAEEKERPAAMITHALAQQDNVEVCHSHFEVCLTFLIFGFGRDDLMNASYRSFCSSVSELNSLRTSKQNKAQLVGLGCGHAKLRQWNPAHVLKLGNDLLLFFLGSGVLSKGCLHFYERGNGCHRYVLSCCCASARGERGVLSTCCGHGPVGFVIIIVINPA